MAVNLSKRRANLKYRYNMNLEQREAMGQRCAICGREDRPVVDHDHRTGRIRGILCHRCNIALGHLGDSPNRLLSAVMYLLAGGIRNA